MVAVAKFAFHKKIFIAVASLSHRETLLLNEGKILCIFS